MELKDPISLSELLAKPITFTVEGSSIDRNDEDLINDDIDDYEPVVQKTPWLYSFDELKQTMQKIPKHEIYKRTITEGTGEMMGQRKCSIKWSYSVFFEKAEHSYDSSFVAGASVKSCMFDELLTGLWFAVETMRKGEESHFVIDYRLMYGELGHMIGEIKVKPKADVLLVAKLVDFREVGCENACDTLTDDELRQFCMVKEKAMEMLKKVKDLRRKGFYSRAIPVNMEIIQRLKFSNTKNDNETKECNRLLVDVYEKLIDCCNKTEDYKKAVKMVNELSQISNIKKNVGVLVNAAIAHSKTDDDFRWSIQLLRIAQALDPKDDRVSRTLADIHKEQDKYKNDTKTFLQRAFQSKPQQQANQSSLKVNAECIELSEIQKQFGKLDIGSNTELIGYTTEELKKLQEDVKHDPKYEIQYNCADGKLKHFIKRIA
ncbi:inactive peptidyl-prolyl cis-trans isomerase shutdown-like [Contarinia nasturtii]|uniref:inactive peptidyl-prolyl cis-trans isomerase shutdown-like n=1 Tax=Contarinia nasturtii TaxID=265458 RepID=UPI0012D4B991|nr:inactive peptidyl-prolyl cis-trans isomerase shutdown-like [Contarinia nasturtii]